MIWFRYLILVLLACCAPIALADDDKGGDKDKDKGGEGDKGGDKKPDGVYLSRKEYDEMMANQKTKDDKDKDEKDKDDEDPLLKKVAKDKADRDAKQADAKSIEGALKFTMGLTDFVTKNGDLLPSDIGELVKASNSETYDSEVAKAAAVKASILKCYFSQQANVDSLTESQKRDLDEYNKLTKTGREERAPTIYANIFEPTLEMHRRLKKADEVRRGESGIQTTSGTEAAYRQKMIDAATKKYLGNLGK